MNKLMIAIAALGISLGSAAIAQDNGDNNSNNGDNNPVTGGGNTPNFTDIDFDHSGGISFDEAQKAWADVSQDQFNTADANGDGQLDQAEFGGLVQAMLAAGASATTNVSPGDSGSDNSGSDNGSGNGSGDGSQ